MRDQIGTTRRICATEAEQRDQAPIGTFSSQPDTDAATTGLHGTVTVGGLLLALPIAAIREVVPRPHELLPFPAVRDDVIGAMALRGAIIPILDPGRLLGLAPAADSPVVLIVRDRGRVIGLAIETICGVVPIGAANLTPLAMASDPTGRGHLLKAGFSLGDRHGLILDARALAALGGIPLVEELTVRAVEHLGGGEQTLFFSAGGLRFGLAAQAIESTVPERPILPSPIADPLWIGMVSFAGQRIPVVDTLHLFGLGAISRPDRSGTVIVRMPAGQVIALCIDAVHDIKRLRPPCIHPLGATPGKGCAFHGLHKDAEHTSLLLHANAVQADPRLATLAPLAEQEEPGEPGRSVNVRDTDGSPPKSSTWTGQPFLLFAAGGHKLAVPLDQVEEIIPHADSGVPLKTSGTALVGLVSHRGRGLALLDVVAALGLTATAADRAFAIVVESEGRHVGFLIDQLDAVERLTLQDLGADAGPEGRLGMIARTVRTTQGACPVVDLKRMACAVTLGAVN